MFATMGWRAGLAGIAFGLACAAACAKTSGADTDRTTVTAKARRPQPAKPVKLDPPPGVAIERDVEYLAPGRQEKLDLYRPEKVSAGARLPAVVIIHGGGWKGGDKGSIREFVTGTALAGAGYVCVSVEYRKDGDDRWPTNLHDCKNAVRWLRKNADRLHVDTDNIGVIGGSAGGHLALMVAYTANVPGLEPESPYPGISSRVQACIDMYGITNQLTRQATKKDGTPTGRLVQTSLFPDKREANPGKWKLASPVFHVTKDDPPTMIIHGTADATVDREQSHELAAKLKETGVEHELVIIPGGVHAFPLNAASLPRDLRPEVIAFFDKHLKPTAQGAGGK